ncbi:MAG: transposase [Planctomycetia bacterium]|nr:transposase [Planctomycetia bacterium]
MDTRLIFGHVFYLPPYSPDFNPDEQVWNYLKHEELKSHQARTKDQLNTQVCHDTLVIANLEFTILLQNIPRI